MTTIEGTIDKLEEYKGNILKALIMSIRNYFQFHFSYSSEVHWRFDSC